MLFRCLLHLGRAHQEAVLAVAAVQTPATNNQPPQAVAVSLQVPQVVKLPAVHSSSRPALLLTVRRMRELLPPGLIIECINLYLLTRTKMGGVK